MTKTQSSGISGVAGAEGRDLAGPRSKIVYNEEAAGRPGTGSSHYRRSSSATRLSVLVARHANVERPARCTCSCTAHRSSVTAAPHTRALSIFLRASSSLYPHLLPFLFEPASGLAVSFLLLRSSSLRASLPATWFSLFFRGRRACSASSLLLLLLLLLFLLLLLLKLLLERMSKPIPSFFLLSPFLSRPFHHASRFSRPYPGLLVCVAPSLALLPIVHTPA